jgi:PAS domain S-box-containing protein
MDKLLIKGSKIDSQPKTPNLEITDGRYIDILKAVAENSETRLAFLDRDFTYLWVNLLYAQEIGYTVQQLVGRNYFDVFPSQPLRGFFERVIETGKKGILSGSAYELPTSLENSVKRWDITATPIKNSNAKFSALVLTVLENSRPNISEKHLSLLSSEWTKIFDNIPYFISINDNNYNIIHANRALADSLQLRLQEVIGQPCYKVLHQSNEPCSSCPIARKPDAHETTTKEYYAPNLKVHLQIITTPILDSQKKLVGCIHIAHSIDRRKKIEQAYYASEEKYRIITENMAGGVLLFEQGREIYANKRVSEILGYSTEELIGLEATELLVPEEKMQILPLMLKKTQNGTISADIDSWVKHKNGERRFVRARYLPLNNKDQPRRFLLIFNDITELKLAEIKLQDLYQTELAMREELEAEINKRIHFTNALVHELKTPLTPILTSSEILYGKLSTPIPKRLVRNVYDGALELSHRIEELLELARIEVGSLNINPRTTSIPKLVKDTVDIMMPEALNKDQTLRYRLPRSLPLIEADASRLRQVLMNLIDNACKYSRTKSNINLVVRKEGDYIIFEVQDDGPGISLKAQNHLFDPYFRISQSKYKIGGLGLGLTISKHLVERHGGHMWVNSERGKGSTFSFSIPFHSRSRQGGKPDEKSEDLDN